MAKMINLFNPYVPEDAISEVTDTLRSRWIGQGERVDRFENDFSNKFNQPYCVSVNSGSAALETAYELAGIKAGDEVIAPCLSCTATNLPLLRMGAKIVWADINPDTLCPDKNDILNKITSKTRAIVNVYLGGIGNDLGEMPVTVITDSAQALGLFGGDYTCNSFQAIKHITSVLPETPVIVKINDKIDIVRIGSLDENIIGNYCLSFDANGNTQWCVINDFIKHPVKEKVIKLKLEKGREVDITKTHSVFTYDNGMFITTQGSDLKVGQYLAAPRKISINGNASCTKIDLVDLLHDEFIVVRNNKIKLAYEGRGGNAGKWINRYIDVDKTSASCLVILQQRVALVIVIRQEGKQIRLICSFLLVLTKKKLT